MSRMKPLLSSYRLKMSSSRGWRTCHGVDFKITIATLKTTSVRRFGSSRILGWVSFSLPLKSDTSTENWWLENEIVLWFFHGPFSDQELRFIILLTVYVGLWFQWLCIYFPDPISRKQPAKPRGPPFDFSKTKTHRFDLAKVPGLVGIEKPKSPREGLAIRWVLKVSLATSHLGGFPLAMPNGSVILCGKGGGFIGESL